MGNDHNKKRVPRQHQRRSASGVPIVMAIIVTDVCVQAMCAIAREAGPAPTARFPCVTLPTALAVQTTACAICRNER